MRAAQSSSQAIAALEGLSSMPVANRNQATTKRRSRKRRISAEARRHMSEAQKSGALGRKGRVEVNSSTCEWAGDIAPDGLTKVDASGLWIKAALLSVPILLLLLLVVVAS